MQVLGQTIFEVGYKYQMTDISTTLGIDGLNDFKKILAIDENLLLVSKTFIKK